MQPRKAHVAGQHHPQNEAEHRHGARLPLHRQGFLDQLLEAEFLQHGRHRKQPTIRGQVVRGEVIGRRSPDFIRLRNNSVNRLIHAPVTRTLISIAHHLGDSWESIREACNLASLLL